MEDLPGWLHLAHTPGIGLRSITALLQFYKNPQTIRALSHARLQQHGLHQASISALQQAPPDNSLLSRTRQWLSHPLNHILHRHHPLYPARLAEIADPPVLLYITGDPEILQTASVGIVGSRKCTSAGIATAEALAADLCALGLSIGSGMALGVDQAAHHAALQRDGLTFAVAGTGLDRVYPARHRQLAQQICQTGALVSELPLGSAPLARHFPRRNRIISGLSLGVVVVEAALRSGSLSTARHARDQGREVMVVPGSIKNPYARGCNALIREGATLVESAADIVAEIAAQIDRTPLITSGSPSSGTQDKPAGEQNTCNLLNLMGFDPITLDSLVALSGLATHAVTISLSQLELEGRVASLSGGRYIRC